MEVKSASHARELEKQAQRRNSLSKVLAERLSGVESILLEPGCGHGHWLTAYAQAHPEVVCVGLDLLGSRVEKAVTKARRLQLDRVHFIKAELGEFLDCLPPAIRFERVIFLFPDPWPKKRHFRRRMIQQKTLSDLAKRSLAGAPFHFRSDDPAYVEWTREHLANHEDWLLQDSLNWPLECETVFQQRMQTYASLTAVRAS